MLKIREQTAGSTIHPPRHQAARGGWLHQIEENEAERFKTPANLGPGLKQ